MLEKSNMMVAKRVGVSEIEALTPLVDSVCRRYLRRRHDVEDAMQDTFVKMLTHGMTPACPRLAGWLSATAGSTCVDQIRRMQSERRRMVGWSQIAGRMRGRGEDEEAGARRVEMALEKLDALSRELLVERYYRRTPLRVIARRAGVSVSTVSRWGTAAVKMLGRELEVESELGAGAN